MVQSRFVEAPKINELSVFSDAKLRAAFDVILQVKPSIITFQASSPLETYFPGTTELV